MKMCSQKICTNFIIIIITIRCTNVIKQVVKEEFKILTVGTAEAPTLTSLGFVYNHWGDKGMIFSEAAWSKEKQDMTN